MEDAIGRLARGDYTEDERLALKVTVEREEAFDPQGATASADEADAGPFYALNDAVIHKSGFARLVRLQVWADDEELGLYSADGIIISTATGSTAYSLSAGGPILVPGLDALVTTPICPHTLAVRPVVHPAEALITVEVAMGDGEVVLTVDGQVGSALRSGDRVIARRSAHPVRLVRFPGQTFFSVLRRKLRWGDVRPLEVGRESP
jgi:NAD+ kinase